MKGLRRREVVAVRGISDPVENIGNNALRALSKFYKNGSDNFYFIVFSLENITKKEIRILRKLVQKLYEFRSKSFFEQNDLLLH